MDLAKLEAEDQDWLVIPTDLGVWRESPPPLSEQRVRLWTLVLEARDIPFCTEQSSTGWLVLVSEEQFIAARRELRLFERENRAWPPRVYQSAPLKDNTLTTVSVLILLATFHNVTGLDITLAGHSSVNWHALGSSDGAKIMAGQWWRLVTALTLHADVGHLVSNLFIGGIFVIWLCRQIGSGLGWSLILLSGVCGNLINVWLNQPEHSSIGASTAVFGTVGILAATNMLRHPHPLAKRKVLPLAAALSLLALFGTEGKNTDLGAHLFGFLSGIILGFMAELVTARFGPPRRIVSALLGTFSACAVIGAWWFAITIKP